MYFKRLELVGFKSFAEKTVLNFEPGVTAVVGPNGCGKSNIADGIRWALGEQSTKSMRASSMQDVIFNGTDTKEPINFSEVSLTLSNEKRILPIDYDEVTISRRIFRSGENEYLLNKTPVRLKDISELLMGTGIGTESYSIIEQGKMDLILSSRPEDRRYVFEEASGITKYKAKKKEALRKLEETEQNLLRINDIIQEVKRQISSIERQAKKAEKYKVELEKLKDLEMRLSSYEYKNLKSDEKTACAQRDDLKVRERESVEIQSQIGAKISEFRNLLEAVSQKISELKGRNIEVLSGVDKNSYKAQMDKERIRELEQSRENLSQEMETLRAKIAGQRELVERVRSDLARTSRERQTKKELCQAKEARHQELITQLDQSEKAVKSNKLETMELLSKETHAKNELIKLGTEVANRSSRERRLGSEREGVAKELHAEEAKINETQRELCALDEKARALRPDLTALREELGSLQARGALLDEELMRARNDEASLKSKVEFLDDLIKRHEGFSVGVKSILAKMRDAAFSGILGVTADLVAVERGYEEAVSSVLGDDVQTIVVKTLDDAIAAISFLRENKLGRANFISLEKLRRFERRRESALREGLSPLTAHVSADPTYGELVEYLFGDTYVVNSIEEAAKAVAAEARFVTRSGICLHRGRLSGGSIGDKEESLLIGRRERLGELTRELESARGRIAECGLEKAEKSRTMESLEARGKELEQLLHQEEINLANVLSKKESQEENARKFREEMSVLELELDETQEAIATLRSREGKAKAELGVISEENTRLQSLIDSLQNTIVSAKEEKDRVGLEIATLKSELASMEREAGGLEGGLKKEEALCAELEESLSSKEDLLRDSVKRREDLANEIVALEAENIALTKDLGLFEEENAKLEKEKSDLSGKLGIEELQLKDRERTVEDLRNQIRDAEMRVMDLNYKKTNLREKMLSAYKVDLDTLHMEIEEDADWETIRATIGELKGKLDEMGPVNLVAIEEHKELEERHSFLTHQQSDLINAKESLHKAILKINKTTKELFIEVFQKIQLEFKNFFRLLFGGGQAELLLIDEQDVLESGIEIVARPPGKKLQNILLLSGGEKALTAIALLFAIFKVKPSPFCVLDEIDAPLDESNVGRFCNVLKDFLKMSQFIIITHNKKTIELADVMYGITMQERGISKIVSVKFLATEKEQEASEEVRTLA